MPYISYLATEPDLNANCEVKMYVKSVTALCSSVYNFMYIL